LPGGLLRGLLCSQLRSLPTRKLLSGQANGLLCG
jgi:hypothetical protein